jgi:hypothetical protein
MRTTAANWSNPHFSPDGTKLAVDIFDGRQTDVWIYEWARDTFSRLTSDPGPDEFPIWTPDGSRVTFASGRATGSLPFNLYAQRADGTGDVEQHHAAPHVLAPDRQVSRLSGTRCERDMEHQDPSRRWQRRVRLEGRRFGAVHVACRQIDETRCEALR